MTAPGSASPDQAERVARAVLTCIAEPGDPAMGALLTVCSPQEVVAALTEGRQPLPGTGAGAGTTAPLFAAQGGAPPAGPPTLARAWPRWSARLGGAPGELDLDAWRREGIRLVIPGDPEWPSQLDVLGAARPWALWVRGNSDLRYACLRSVSLVGTRVATAYGAYVGTEMAVTLAERGWTIVSGGAYGIDSCAHRGALAAEGTTIAVLACGVHYTYPRGHHDLFQAIHAAGASVSEWPPGRTPTRPGFLVRNRVIAALSRGTVVVEAARRSGALNTARHARDQNRPLMAVPGPVTSTQSAGCHEIIREWGAICVTSAHDVMELLSFPDGDLGERERGAVLPRDELDPVVRKVLEAVPARAGRGPRESRSPREWISIPPCGPWVRWPRRGSWSAAIGGGGSAKTAR